MMMKPDQLPIRIIGGGLAGPEAALTAARLGCEVDLYEMRPVRITPAHQTADFAELVCSNSLKSESENTAPWLLKQEMRRAGSALLQAADATAVPAGHALAVDRVEFSRRVAAASQPSRASRVHREEVTHLDPKTASPSSPPARSPHPPRRRNRAPHRQRAPRLLRLHLPHRRRRHHRHGAGLLRRTLRQRHRRLHQLPRSPKRNTTASTTPSSPPNRSKKKNGRNSTTSKAACPSRNSPAAAATLSASAP